MQTPDDLRYSAEHEWVRLDGDIATVGITDFAQDALGDVVFVEVPAVGQHVTRNSACAEIESTKSVSEIYAPMSGTVEEVNETLADAPELVNSDPYGDGWIMQIRVTEPAEIDELLDAPAYRAATES